MSRVKKQKRITMKEAKQEVSSLGLVVSPEYDKRFINTWLYTLGQEVEPVLRNKIVHVKKEPKKKVTWADLMGAANEVT